ncbi:MAG: peptide MFS transporter [Chitinophagales bacterium]|nr:peptide MFS transporter [Chitinophagales bacterium]
MENTPVRRGHPRGLYVLFFTEMWERFGYYLMVGIFLLYLTDTLSNGGRGFDNHTAIDIVGSYVALVYLSPFIGGMIADRFIGYIRAIFIGGTLMAAGYFGLSIPGTNTLMYLSLLCIIVGNGFFKPNISTLLGIIYNKEDLKPKKDSAYMIFYMGINIGAFVCNFVASYLRNTYGWGYAFAGAGVGMLLGLIWFASGLKHVKHANIRKPVQKEDMPFSKIMLYVFVPALVAGAIGWMIPGTLFGSDSSDAFMAATIPIIIFYFLLWRRGSPEDRKSIAALLVIFGVSIVFWVIYNQNSTSQTLWAQTYTNRSIPSYAEGFTKALGMQQTVNANGHDTIPIMDQYFQAQTNEEGKVKTTVGVDPYFQNLPKDKWPAAGTNQKLISTELFQSINPFFIIIFTPLIVAFFAWLHRRRKEPTTPAKIGWGIFISGLSALVMVFAAWSVNIYSDKTNASWLIMSYAVFTVGELCLSPIGLSLVSKIAPPRLTALMMGGWFLSTAIGGKLAGTLASSWDVFIGKQWFFMILFIAAAVAALAVWYMVKWLNSIVHEQTGE